MCAFLSITHKFPCSAGGGFSNAARPIWSTGTIVNTRAPERRQQRPPQRRPQPQFVPEARPAGPSQCVWAIVNCCASNSLAVRYECFERLGCNGAFWDLNPCSDFVLNAALDESDTYFSRARV